MTHIPKHYIDRDSVARALSTVFSDTEHGNPYFINGIITAVDFILNYPIEDVEEVRHGKWVLVKPRRNGRNATYKCTVCNRLYSSYYNDVQEWTYCPCGAKMDGGKEECQKH